MSDEIAQGLPPLREDDEEILYAVPPIRKAEPSAIDVFFAWEKLRILYNFILVAVFVVRIGWQNDDWGLETLVPGVLFANLVFCAGHVGEGYLCLAGIPRRVARAILFLLGMCIAGCAAISVQPRDLGGPFH